MEFKVGDIVRATKPTKSSSNYIIPTGSIWRVCECYPSLDEYDIRIDDYLIDTPYYKYGGIWANSADFEICKMCEIKEGQNE